MTPDSTRAAAYSRLFSSAVFRELATAGKSPLFSRLLKSSLCVDGYSVTGKVRDAFEAAYKVLCSVRYRDEYIYKAALTHKVLLGTHSLNSAVMLSEFRVGTCKADLVILNGTATVYEIKSERDSLSRLAAQIKAYNKVFPRVFVIAGENHIDAVLDSTDTAVGVLQLSKRHQISTLRDAQARPDHVCPITIFDSIRLPEAIRILRMAGHEIPDLPNIRLRAELRKAFEKLSPKTAHEAMVSTLKVTRSLAPLAQLIDDLPPSLHAAALSLTIKKTERQTLLRAVDTDLHEAMEWV